MNKNLFLCYRNQEKNFRPSALPGSRYTLLVGEGQLAWGLPHW